MRQRVMEENIHKLKVPRRPPWTSDMSADELDVREREYFLHWRRDLATCALSPRANSAQPTTADGSWGLRLNARSPIRSHVRSLEETDTVTVTPFEKNLQVWRQLWRVLERSDLVRPGARFSLLLPLLLVLLRSHTLNVSPADCCLRWFLFFWAHSAVCVAKNSAPDEATDCAANNIVLVAGVPSGGRPRSAPLPLRGPRGLRARGAPGARSSACCSDHGLRRLRASVPPNDSVREMRG